jgi:hypothetical protein
MVHEIVSKGRRRTGAKGRPGSGLAMAAALAGEQPKRVGKCGPQDGEAIAASAR